MANRSYGRGQQNQTTPQPGIPAFTEPEVRRWPHPVDGTEVASGDSRQFAVRQTDAALHYIHCALSYQNQLLADIKTLLEQMAADAARPQEENSG